MFEPSNAGQLFNTFCPKGLVKSPEFSTVEMIHLFKKHSSEICALLDCAKNIKLEINSDNLHKALDVCDEFIEKKGVSIYLLKIISLITNRYQLFTLED
ncbi:hypothetical protein, partial [Cronobacter dublinensis]|uniref:hypothetical protein n=1 Tax=Cronobacter dublinensis TaxID=413497 RepID=UPI00131A13B8